MRAYGTAGVQAAHAEDCQLAELIARGIAQNAVLGGLLAFLKWLASGDVYLKSSGQRNCTPISE